MRPKKAIGNGIFLAAIFALTVYGVFHGEDLGDVLEALREADPWMLLPGVALVLFYIWGESIILWYMLGSFGLRLKKRICFLFSSVGFFFSCITPSASGGQPMQIYYMKKEKIPIPVAAVILMIVTITYKLVLVVIGAGVLVLGAEFKKRYLGEVLPVFTLGVFLNVFCVMIMTILVFHPALAETLLTKGMRLLERIRFLGHKEERLKKLGEAMEAYRETAVYLKTHGKVIFWVILVTFAQRFALFGVTLVVYLAFGLSGAAMWDVVMLQAVISVSVDMLPLPGGMGISEILFMRIFPGIFGEMLLPGMILSRGIGYYSQLLISAVFTVAAQLYYSLRREE